MAGSTGQPIVVTHQGVVIPEPVAFADRAVSEGLIQSLLDENPQILPIDDIGPSWGPLVSLGREIPTTAGPIDNLFVSPTGELTVVEAKLWRNPESRRKVVGQILDYAAALRNLSYEELDAAVADGGSDQSIWQLVQEQTAVDASAEARFVDTVHRNLRAGRFLLLVAGDGIKEDIVGLADLIGRHPDIGFHLELVELRLYRLGNDMLVVPSLVGRTNEVTRAIVEVRTDGRVHVTVEPEEDERTGQSRSRPLRSLDSFVELASAEIGPERATAVERFARTWESRGGVVKLNTRSVNLAAPSQQTKSGRISLVTLGTSGIAEFSIAPLTEWRPVITPDEAHHLAAQHGFTQGSPSWPKRQADLTDGALVEELLSMLDLLAQRVTDLDAQTSHREMTDS